jgi:hypothetical protein
MNRKTNINPEQDVSNIVNKDMENKILKDKNKLVKIKNLSIKDQIL